MTEKTEEKKIQTTTEKLKYIQQNLKAPKSQYNSFGKYHYRNCEDILQAVKPLLDELDCVLTINDELVELGGRFYVKATAKLINIEMAQHTIHSIAYARESENKKGMDSAQITGATSSYARKYALNGLFAIDDTKDPDNQDNRESEQQKENPSKNNSPKATKPETNNQDEKMILNFIIEQLAPKAGQGKIIDIDKLEKAIIDKYGQLPTKQKNGKTVVGYILNELGVENVCSDNDFLEGLS